MKVNIEELSSVERRVTVEIPAAEVDKTLNKLYQRLGRQAKIRGFRPGKAPRSILEKYYGPQVVAETAETLIQDAYPKALDEIKLEPVARPSFDFGAPVAGSDFVFKVTMDVKPDFELDSALYKGLKLKEPKLEASEDEVASRLEALRDRQAMLAPLEEDRPAQIGDVVVVDYKSFIGDQPVEGGAAENMEIELGKGQAQEEIELALVKAKPGDQVEAKVDYDENSPNEQVRGKQVRFELNVKALKKKMLPDLDDDFARAVSPEFESLAVLRERISSELAEAYQQQKDQALRAQILDQLRELGQFDVPQSLITAEIESMVEDFKNRLRRSGMDPDQAGLDSAKLGEGFRPEAEKKVRAGIVLGRIAEMEKVDVGQEDIDGEVGRVAARMGQPAGVVKDMYIKNNMMPTLSARLLEEKTLQVIKASANIELVDPAELAKETEEKGQS